MAAKVALVEPDEDQRNQFTNAIKGSAFEVTAFLNTNAEAVEKYGELRPDVLVLRLVSGKLGAAAALDRLRKKHRNVKAVASYDVRSTHLLMAAYSHGAVAAIKQPFRLHRVVEKLTFAVASERHASLAGPIVRLEHPLQVRYKTDSLLSFGKVAFCERLGLSDMDLNLERPPKPKTKLKLELMLPTPAEPMKLAGVVEAAEATRPDNHRVYLALKNVSSQQRAAIESFLVKAAKRI